MAELDSEELEPVRGDEILPLLDRARAGDETAWSALDAVLRPWFLAEAANRLAGKGCPQASSSDVAQETLLRVFRGLEHFRGEHSAASFWSWVKMILKNQILNTITRQPQVATGGSLGSPDSSAVGMEPPCTDPSPSEVIGTREEDAERRRKLAAAIPQLDATDRAVFVGYYFDEKSDEVLAKELGLGPKEVEGRRRRAREELRTLLGAST